MARCRSRCGCRITRCSHSWLVTQLQATKKPSDLPRPSRAMDHRALGAAPGHPPNARPDGLAPNRRRHEPQDPDAQATERRLHRLNRRPRAVKNWTGCCGNRATCTARTAPPPDIPPTRHGRRRPNATASLSTRRTTAVRGG